MCAWSVGYPLSGSASSTPPRPPALALEWVDQLSVGTRWRDCLSEVVCQAPRQLGRDMHRWRSQIPAGRPDWSKLPTVTQLPRPDPKTGQSASLAGAVTAELTEGPRETLGWMTPSEKLSEFVAATA